MPEQNDQSFEESLRKLEEIIVYLDSGRADLDSSLEKYEEGVRLLRLCRSKLSEAEQKFEMLKSVDPETNTLETVPVDPDELRSDESTAGRGSSVANKRRNTKERTGDSDS